MLASTIESSQVQLRVVVTGQHHRGQDGELATTAAAATADATATRVRSDADRPNRDSSTRYASSRRT